MNMLSIRRPSLPLVLIAFVYALQAAPLRAQSLPPPSRIMYKCVVKGTTTYSDTPCLGATRMDVEPTRGISKLSGTDRIGNDVARERYRENLAEALHPLTGMDGKQFATATRRYPLSGTAKLECRQLDESMPVMEDEEKRVAQPMLRDVQTRLYRMRLRFKELGC
jgi:hypothetical protein